MAYDTKTFLLQTGLKSLGYDFGPEPSAKYGKIDGDFGPKTQAAISAFEATRAGQPDAPKGTLAVSLVDVATQQLVKDIRETSKNQGPEIAKFWTATSYPTGYANREPYCAAFVCWLVREAVAGRTVAFSLPKSALAYDLEPWARANAAKGVSVVKTPKAGDLFTLATASHCGLVVGVSGSTVITIEGNTDGTGGREGDGVYKRSRPISTIRQFIRINA
jgi:peptidoglycan hydrolase-like protein with peptidoglycan-binding domain